MQTSSSSRFPTEAVSSTKQAKQEAAVAAVEAVEAVVETAVKLAVG